MQLNCIQHACDQPYSKTTPRPTLTHNLPRLFPHFRRTSPRSSATCKTKSTSAPPPKIPPTDPEKCSPSQFPVGCSFEHPTGCTPRPSTLRDVNSRALWRKTSRCFRFIPGIPRGLSSGERRGLARPYDRAKGNARRDAGCIFRSTRVPAGIFIPFRRTDDGGYFAFCYIVVGFDYAKRRPP